MFLVLVVIAKSRSSFRSCDMQAPLIFHLMLLPISRTRVTFLPLSPLRSDEGTRDEPFIYTGRESPIAVASNFSAIVSHPLKSGAPSTNGGLASVAVVFDPVPDADPEEFLADDPVLLEVEPELEELDEVLEDVLPVLDDVPVLVEVLELLVPVLEPEPVVPVPEPVVFFVDPPLVSLTSDFNVIVTDTLFAESS